MLQPSNAGALAELFTAAFRSPKKREFFQWKYFDNPAGQIVGYGAPYENRLVASHGNIPLQIKIGDEVCLGAQSVDAMVAAEARRQGMWARIARASYVDMDRDGLAVNYCLPSPVAKVGFVEKLGWTYLGEIPRYIKPLDVQGIVADGGMRGGVKRLLWRGAMWQAGQGAVQRSTNHIAIKPITHFDARFGRLWEQSARDFPIAVVRDAAYLNWRYLAHPNAGQYVCLSAEKQGSLCAYAVLSLTDPHVAHLLELIVAPGAETAAHNLLQVIVQRAQVAGAAQLQAFMLPQYKRYLNLLRTFGFIHQTGRLTPGELGYTAPFIVRPHPATAFPVDVTHLSNWFISMGDHDYY